MSNTRFIVSDFISVIAVALAVVVVRIAASSLLMLLVGGLGQLGQGLARKLRSDCYSLLSVFNILSCNTNTTE